IKFICELLICCDYNLKYIIYHDCDLFTSIILEGVISTLKPHENYSKKQDLITSFHLRSNSDAIDTKIAALGIGESKKILNYQIIGGNNTQIYLQMKSRYAIETA